MRNEKIKKYPADTTLDRPTFLNDKKIDGDLYTVLLDLADFKFIDERLDIVPEIYLSKKKMPTKKALATTLGIKSTATITTKLNYLIEKHYLVQDEDPESDVLYYFDFSLEKSFLKVPNETITFLKDNCQKHVTKIYIYLMQKFKFAKTKGKPYIFSTKEIGTHIGISVEHYSEGYRKINNALELLINNGLISITEVFVGQTVLKRLDNVSETFKHNLHR